MAGAASGEIHDVGRRRAALVATALLWGACNSPPTVVPAKAAAYAPVVAALTEYVGAEMSDKHIPGLSLALVDGDEIVWAQGFGVAERGTPAAADTVYRVGSVSKLFTDVAVMQLVERGELDLDAPIETCLPELAPRNPFGGAITLRELMSHRSGLVREPPVGQYFDPTEPSLAETVASLNGTELVYAPGSRVKYSNAGIAVVGYVLERLAREPFAATVQRAVLEPLGLEHSVFAPTPELERRLARGVMWSYDGREFAAPTFQLGMAPAGSLYSTVLDLGRFLTVVFDDGRGPGGPVLQPATLAEMLTPQFAEPGARRGFGLGFAIGELAGHTTFGHGGTIYGFATQLQFMKDEELGAVVCANVDVVNSVTNRIARQAQLVDADHVRLGDVAYERVEREQPAPVPERFAGLVGEYSWDHDVLFIYEQDGVLHALIEWIEIDPLTELSADAFAFPENGGLYHGERLIFRRDTRGRATEVGGRDHLFTAPDPGRGRTDLHDRAPAAGRGAAARGARRPAARGARRVPRFRPARAHGARSDAAARRPLRQHQQLPAGPLLRVGARLPPAPGRRGARARAPQARPARLRPAHPRRLPPLVRDQDVLGRAARRPAPLRRRPGRGLAPQPRLRRRPHALRAQHGRTGRDGRALRRDERALLSRLRRRHLPAALAPRAPARRHGGRGLPRLRVRVVALRLPRLGALPHPERDLRAARGCWPRRLVEARASVFPLFLRGGAESEERFSCDPEGALLSETLEHFLDHRWPRAFVQRQAWLVKGVYVGSCQGN